eukprot:TRINITY_DN2373_c0_g1_i14.p1 TRINITY_DN2373_c0_g1~~TRINITY_DN2373_c0_g1_i14.p1  ORF type:complete len:100 (+),score=0.55 TRINITY_DN2373_c0_g1_i14:308-607(+)
MSIKSCHTLGVVDVIKASSAICTNCNKLCSGCIEGNVKDFVYMPAQSRNALSLIYVPDLASPINRCSSTKVSCEFKLRRRNLSVVLIKRKYTFSPCTLR